MSSISVLIAVRDGERYLAAAIESVLGGTVEPDEVLVIDDGSSDGSAAVAAGFGPPVRCLPGEPLGLAGALNRGVAVCRGELIAFLDADDLWTADKLELQLELLGREPGLEAAFGAVVEFATPELSAEQRAEVRIQEEPVQAQLRGAMLARRTLLERVGPFQESLGVGDFVEWGARAQDAGMRSAYVGEVVLRRRIHTANWGRLATAPGLDYVRVVRGIMERRRGAAR